MENEALIRKRFWQEKSYAPYSKFHVGAALLTKKGECIQAAILKMQLFLLLTVPTDSHIQSGQ